MTGEDTKPGLWDRIKAFFLLVWNWTILLAAIAGFLLCLRLTYVFSRNAWESTDAVTTLLFAGGAATCLAGVAFLGWQSWRGIRYLRYRRRQG